MINKEKINLLLQEIKNELFCNGTDEEYNKYMYIIQTIQQEIYNV